MADTKISQLPSAGAITGAELVPIVQDGATRRVPVSAVIAGDVVSYDDALTDLGAATVQDALVALKALAGA